MMVYRYRSRVAVVNYCRRAFFLGHIYCLLCVFPICRLMMMVLNWMGWCMYVLVFTDQAHLHRKSLLASIKGCTLLANIKQKGFNSNFKL